MESKGSRTERLYYVIGRVEETVPDRAPERIALLRLHTDWYEFTRHELENLLPRLAKSGALIDYDYGHWEVARRAADEFVTSSPQTILFSPTEYSSHALVVLAVSPEELRT